MNLKKAFAAVICAASFSSAFAGGLLTNTNQNIAFLRCPAREGAIAIDGVYSNPAGVVFLPEGYHLSLNWQAAFQTRTVETTSTLLDHTMRGQTKSKEYKGNAQVPFLPSVQFAYNKDKWSIQASFAVTGGGGSCEFSSGLGSFEMAVGQIAQQLNPLGASSYDMEGYMKGSQYYFGFTVGAAYKVTDNLSVYGGLRALYGVANYKANISDIIVNGNVPFNSFVDGIYASDSYKQLSQMYAAYGDKMPAEYLAKYQSLSKLGDYKDGVKLQCDQTGFAVAPIIGIDWKFSNFNFAAKYEFRTAMKMKNTSTVEKPIMPAVGQFVDGTSVSEDSPSLLALGGQWSPLPYLHINAGYHHFYDKASKKYNDKQDLLSGGTNEYLGGVEVNTTDKVTVSAGVQVTRYGLTDAYMSDLSFVTNSWSFGFGCKYKVNDNVSLQAAYFKTFYDNYKTADGVNNFSRTNDVIGVCCDIDF